MLEVDVCGVLRESSGERERWSRRKVESGQGEGKVKGDRRKG